MTRFAPLAHAIVALGLLPASSALGGDENTGRLFRPGGLPFRRSRRRRGSRIRSTRSSWPSWKTGAAACSLKQTGRLCCDG